MDEKNVKNEYEILKIETGKKPFKKTIGTDLRDLQNEVDGLIEVIYSDDEFVIIANEEGKINGSKPNRRFGNDIIAGDFFIIGENSDGDFCSLKDVNIDKWIKLFDKVEEFSEEDMNFDVRMTFVEFKNKY